MRIHNTDKKAITNLKSSFIVKQTDDQPFVLTIFQDFFLQKKYMTRQG
jgi:hypothetical protein